MGEANRRKARDDARSRRDAITEYELREMYGDPSRATEYKEKLASYTALKERELAEAASEERNRAATVIAASTLAAAGDTKSEGFKGKKNLYICDTCHGHIVTVDVDEGVTPFIIGCARYDGYGCVEGCNGFMQSAMYRVPQKLKASHEWYYPDPTEMAKLKGWDRDHVNNGGLIFRKASR